MLLAERVSLIAGAGILALSLLAAPQTAMAQTPPPLPPAADDAGPADDDDLPPPNSRRGEDDGPPPVNNDDQTRADDDEVPPPPPPPDLAYYVVIGGNQSGPLGEAQLIELIKGGQLTPDTQVWTKGMAGWEKAGAVAEVAALIQQHAPVAPPPPPPPPGPEYFIIVNGQQVGPMTPDQLKQAIAAGQITRQTQIWTKGMAGWTAAGDVPELAGLFPPAPDNRTGTTVRVESYCGATGKSGIGEGPDFNTARDRAIQACIANGGLPRCCPNSIRQIE